MSKYDRYLRQLAGMPASPSPSPAPASPKHAKARVADLASFGGAPVFPSLLHVGRPNIGDRDAFLAHAATILEDQWLTNNGPYVRRFEDRIAATCGVPHCIATSNATAGIEVLVRALGLDGEVIVPAFTFVATAHALEWLGLTPVFCDVDPVTHCLDPSRVEALITPRTSAIFGVHLWGQACDAGALQAIADAHGLKLIFDAAHAFGSQRCGRPVGGFGDAEVLSFHATKFVNAFEGGAIVTRDPALAERCRLMRNFGFEFLDSVVSPGINAKMTEICAAMGLVSLDAMDRFVACNAANYDAYRNGLSGIPGVSLFEFEPEVGANYQYVVVQVHEREAGIARDLLLRVLLAEGIFARRYFYPGVHRMQPYASRRDPESWDLPVTGTLAASVFQLPTGESVTPGMVGDICRLIRFVVEHAGEVNARLDVLEAKDG